MISASLIFSVVGTVSKSKISLNDPSLLFVSTGPSTYTSAVIPPSPNTNASSAR